MDQRVSYNSARNGSLFPEPLSEQAADKALDEMLTLNYRAQLPLFNVGDGANGMGFNGAVLRDVEEMLASESISAPYEMYKGAIASVKFVVKADSSKIGEFAHKNFARFWERSLGTAQNVYDYGFLGSEVAYRTEHGYRHFDSLHDLHPFDTWAVTKRGHYRGFGLQNCDGPVNSGRNGGGHMLLWGPANYPAKGFWLTHRKRYNRFYGRSQLYAAWRPWRVLATRDGAEECVNGGVYRFAYQGPVVRYPKKSFKKKGTTSGDTTDYDAARDKSREFMENAKAGAGVALPNDFDKETGHYDWELEWPNHVLDPAALVAYCEWLEKKIAKGVGVPPELLEAQESGSGYSGRRIPLQGFYTTQLANARNFAHAFKWQILDPLIKWNYGRGHVVDIGVSLSLPAGMQQDQPGQQGGAPGQPPGQPGDGAAAPIPHGGGGTPLNYRGPRGGIGIRDASTGRIHYRHPQQQ